MNRYAIWGIGVLGLAIASLYAYCAWNNGPSFQGRIERILADERTAFVLSDVFGNEWKTLCFFPENYGYASHSNEGLLQWVSDILGRRISGDEWRHVAIQDEIKRIHVLTDRGPLKESFSAEPWQGNDANSYYVACTSDKHKLVNARWDGKVWRLDYAFEHVWKLNK